MRKTKIGKNLTLIGVGVGNFQTEYFALYVNPYTGTKNVQKLEKDKDGKYQIKEFGTRKWTETEFEILLQK